MQLFKGDDTEIKMDASAANILQLLEMQLDLFNEGAYEAMPLGDVIHDEKLSPLVNAIVKDVFRSFFNDLFTQFQYAGSFESYLTVFRKIFGDEVEVEFTVPAPGKLVIDIAGPEIELSNWIARHIVGGEYIFDEIVDESGDNIVFQNIKGFTSQYELEQMLFEMVPDGVFTDINLTLS